MRDQKKACGEFYSDPDSDAFKSVTGFNVQDFLMEFRLLFLLWTLLNKLGIASVPEDIGSGVLHA
jgi:hypothetical protein